MQESPLIVENSGAVRRIWLNRGDAANAQTREMLVELDAEIAQARADDSVRTIVLAGKGKHFSAGHDLREAQAKRSDFTAEERWRYEEHHYLDYCLNIWDCPKPVVAQVQGACVAGGLMLANMADLIVAADDAWFWDSVTFSMGLAGTEILFQPWVMGLRHAKEFLFTGERIEAADAYRIGMVNRVVPRQALDGATMAIAQRIANAPPFAIQALKKSLNRTYDIQGFRNAVMAHFDTHQVTHASSEFAQIRDRGMAKVIENNKTDLRKSHEQA
ncbi:Enoyl-CoA hydratase (plasmid) [Paraburkholderia caribensis MBA4]|uniref:Enoyl-CoA hydratase n=1 Tax=Paraburkholderia caribensis MBA4 TaxID=1323664 RepID=A0A0N7JW63_9BURK|nr:enoyl-CoA hydratase [Paraburkholderia caribensis]ALL71133.1 Enoyl-CoA hydratase [Paraburkholderia caribensis MBA4]